MCRLSNGVTSLQSASIETESEDSPPLARPVAFQTLQAGSTERNEKQPVTFSARQKTGEVKHGDTTVSG